MIGAIIEGIMYLIFHVMIDIFIIGTGEIVLYCITLGKRKPIWKRECQGAVAKLSILIDLSFIIGFIFWLSFIWLIFNRH